MKFIHFLSTFFLLAGTAIHPLQAQQQDLCLVPYPNDITVKTGQFKAAGAPFRIAPEIDSLSREAILRFADALSLNTGIRSAVTTTGRQGGFVFLCDKTLGEEAYRLESTTDQVTVKAADLNGFCYAVETLKQLLPCAIYGKARKEGVRWTLPCIKINDAPRFHYRGMLLDVARHFYSVEEVERFLDQMAFHKMNRFHWHLTDDQGWRIEIKKYPKLTEIGSMRHGTMIRKDWNSCDNIPYGGFYTQEEIKEVIRYAAERGITIIPEIDLPGHMLAALAAYPEYGCTGGPYAVGHKWGISDDVLCVGKEASMRFLEDVLTEIADLFPGEYIHIGGDECPKTRWENCPDCQAKIRELGLKDDGKHKAEHYLQSYVTDRIEAFLTGKGKKIIGWDEVLEGKLQGNATIMSWRGVKGGEEAVRAGHDAIMTPDSHLYFDYYQSTDTDNEPLAIGGYIPVRKCYAFEPFSPKMTDEEKARILGVQANMWTEYVKSTDHLDYMILPRMSALSEVQWCQPENKSWMRFTSQAEQLFRRYDVQGWNYALHIFDTLYELQRGEEKGTILLKLRANKDVPISYEISGDSTSRIYTEPIVIRDSCTVTATAEWTESRQGMPLVLDFGVHKAFGQPYKVNGTPEAAYGRQVNNLLTDGIRGREAFQYRTWAGWREEDLDVTIDLSDRPVCSSITLSTNVQKASHIFNPMEIIVSTSEDGENFQEVARMSYPAEGEHEPDGPKTYSLPFQESAVRYLRVIARPFSEIPEWHPGHGSKAYLFANEIIVR